MSGKLTLLNKKNVNNQEAIDLLKQILISAQGDDALALSSVAIVCIYEDGTTGTAYVGDQLDRLVSGMTFIISRINDDFKDAFEGWLE